MKKFIPGDERRTMTRYRLDFAKKYLDDAMSYLTRKDLTALHQGPITHHIKPCGLP